MATFCYGMIDEVCVMLVDNDKEFVIAITNLLKSHNYTAMTVDTISTAMLTLSKGKQKIDMMILNVHSTNLLSFDLLRQAVALDIISLVVCDELDEIVAKKVLDDGAYLYLKKPLNKEIVNYLWQFVLSEKIRREKARERSEKNNHLTKKNVSDTEEQSNTIHEAENDVILNGKYKLRRNKGIQSMKEINEGESQNNATSKVVRQKNYIEWTEDLHTKFMEAVELLGEGRCYPMEILEVMNVPGLTRMQVASHLQKCRRNNWRSPKERKSNRHRSCQQSSSVSHAPRSGFRKFGTMPRLQANVSNQRKSNRYRSCQQSSSVSHAPRSGFRKFGTMPRLQGNVPNQTQRGQGFPFPTLNTTYSFARGESSIQQLYCPQLQVQPHRLNIGNQILTTQTNVGGGLQHGPLFDLNVSPSATYSGSRIVLGTDIENTTSVDNVITYSSSAMKADTYVGNVTINGSGATNASESNTYFNFNNMGYLFQNLEPPSTNLPSEQGREFDQVAGTSSIQLTGIENHSDESSM